MRRKFFRRAMVGEDLISILNQTAKPVTKEEALDIPSLAGCINFISSTIAMLPIELKSRDNTVINENDSRVWLLNGMTGDTLDAYQMKKAWIEDMLTDGEGFIHINRRRNAVESLHYVQVSKVAVMEGADSIFKDYDIMVDGVKYRDFDFLKLTRKTKNGVTGEGVIDENNKILSVAYNTLEFEDALVRSGGKKGFLQSDKKVDKTVIDELKAAWKKFYSRNSENIMVLNNGIKFTEAALSSVEMQLAENKKANAEEICTIFNLSPGIINGTCNDEEYNNGIKTAVLPVIRAIETALNKDLLLQSEQRSLYFVIDTKPLLKGDILKRYTAYGITLEKNFLQIDEVREEEGKTPMGIDFVKIGLNDVLYYPKTGQVYTPNTKELAKLRGGEIENDESGNTG